MAVVFGGRDGDKATQPAEVELRKGESDAAQLKELNLCHPLAHVHSFQRPQRGVPSALGGSWNGG